MIVLPVVVFAVVAGLIVVLRKRFVAVRVDGSSMEPALRSGDRVLVRRVRLARVRRGAVVVLAPPPDLPPDLEDPPWLIKRAVALPGDVVPAAVTAVSGEVVPAGRFVVLGDNTRSSYDSRRAGYFAADALLGVVVARLKNS